MGVLDRAAASFGFVRQDSVSVAPAPGPTIRQREQRRADDFASVITNYAGRPSFGPSAGLYIADELYSTDGLASLIIDRPAEDAVARGFTIEGDENDDVLNEMDRLDAGPAITDALRWARLYGAAAVLPLIDGQPLDAPLDVSRITQITDLMVYPATAISTRAERYADPAVRNYGLPVAYDIRPRWGTTFAVHESRLIPVPGESLSYTASNQARLPWLGRPALDACAADLHRYRDGLRLAKLILERKQQPVHKLSGLGEMLSANLDDVVAKRLETADLVRNLLTTISVDAEDSFDVLDSSLGGIDAVLREFKIALAASSGIPVAILFGETVSGLQSTGRGELESYHSRVRQLQERAVRPLMEALAGLIWAQRSLPAREPERWRIVFTGLWSPSETEMADVEAKRAAARKAGMEAVVVLVDAGLASPEECRDMARATVFPELPMGPPPEPPEPELPDGEAGLNEATEPADRENA